MQRTGRNGAPAGKQELNRGAVMKQFGAPRRGLPRRPGAFSAHLIDRETALPNRFALMAEIDFALANHGTHVGVVLVRAAGLPAHAVEGDTGVPGSADLLIAVSKLFRKAVRPTDLVTRTAPDELAAACWGLEDPTTIGIVAGRLRSRLTGPLAVSSEPAGLQITIGVGVVGPGSSAAEAVGYARADVGRNRPLARP